MVRFSNSIIGILNFAIFLLSIPILVGGIWLARRADTDCEKFLQWPVIAIGGFLMLVSLAGLAGACCRVTWLLWVYLAVMFILILLLFCFTVFAFVVTNKGAGQAVGNRGYKEYRLGDYSNWLQKRVEKSSNWNKIKSCLHDAKVCKSLADDSVNEVAEQFYKKNLSPTQVPNSLRAKIDFFTRCYFFFGVDCSRVIPPVTHLFMANDWEKPISHGIEEFNVHCCIPKKSGCCKPPTSCNFVYVNATVWTPPTTNSTSTDTDCITWSNVQDQLCYNCNSCKAGVLANLKHDWRKIAIINIVVLIALIVVYSIGCCAFRNNRRDERYGYKGNP